MMNPELITILNHSSSKIIREDSELYQLIVNTCNEIQQVYSMERLRDTVTVEAWLGLINLFRPGNDKASIKLRLQAKTILISSIIVQFIYLVDLTLLRQYWPMFTLSRFQTKYMDLGEEIMSAPSDALQVKDEPVSSIHCLRQRELQRLWRLERLLTIVFDRQYGLCMNIKGKGEAIRQAVCLLIEPYVFRCNGSHASRMTMRRLSLFYQVSGLPIEKQKRTRQRKDCGIKRPRDASFEIMLQVIMQDEEHSNCV